MSYYWDYNEKKYKQHPVVNLQKNQKIKSGSLVWIYCGKETVIKENQPFALLQTLKTKLSKESQYKGGELKIVNYKK